MLVQRTVTEQVWVSIEAYDHADASATAEDESHKIPRDKWDQLEVLAVEAVETDEV